MRASLCIMVAAVMALSLHATAQEPPAARMIAPPDPAVMIDAFPPVALATGVSGAAILSCNVSATGEAACTVAEESPPDAGFGAAALRVVQSARFAPAEQNGAPIASTARIPVRFPTSSERAPIIRTIEVTTTRTSEPLSPPTEDDGIMRYYPQSARAMGIEGDAVVACAVRTTMSIECGLEREAPEGLGFGERALLIARAARLQDASIPAGTAFRLRTTFRINASGGQSAGSDESDWLRRPTPAELEAAYPPRARRQGIDGLVELYCDIREGGTLQCRVGGESPAGFGFGEAARSLEGLFQVAPEMLGRPGRAIGDRLRIPVHFVSPP